MPATRNKEKSVSEILKIMAFGAAFICAIVVIDIPLYEMGMGRVGCIPCINCRKSELLEISKRFPEAIDRIEAWESAVALAGKAGEASFFPDPDPDRQAGKQMRGVRNMVEWSKTGRGGHNYDWIKAEDEGPLCSSIYGLCE